MLDGGSPDRAVVDVARSAKDSSQMTAVSALAACADPRVGSPPILPPELLAIDAFDRMLLTTDGTVTTLLEACTGEPMVTRTIRQAGPATIDQLGAGAGVWWHIVEIVAARAGGVCDHLGVPRRTTLTRRTYTIAFRDEPSPR
jgi:hypothetical protein